MSYVNLSSHLFISNHDYKSNNQEPQVDHLAANRALLMMECQDDQTADTVQPVGH